jgi:site-specific recombinase XerD
MNAESAELVSNWLIAYPSSTRDSYRRDVGQFADWLDGDLVTADRDDVQRWLAHLRDGLELSAATVRRKTSAIASFYSYCVQEKHISQNPCKYVRRPRGENAPKRGLTLDQAQDLLEEAKSHSTSSHALVWLMAGAGLRVAEACRASIEDVHGSLLTVRVKGGSTQIKPLSAPVLEAVHLASSGREEGRIVTNSDGRPISVRRAQQLIEEMSKRAGIEDCTPHTLRHTCATIALSAGARLEDVSQLLGHKSLETTLRYVQGRDILGGTMKAAATVGAALEGVDSDG